jgi:WD40 repeat protein
MDDLPEFRIYLSSTIDDLKEERLAAIEILRRHAVVKDSYRASEEATVATCIKDVRATHLYVGILGQRYGWVPDNEDNPNAKSITELEYEACEMEGHPPIPRLIFVRTTNPDRYTDAYNRPLTAERIRKFRESKKQQSFHFDTLDEFRIALSEAVMKQRAIFHREKTVAREAKLRAILRRPTPQDFTGYLAIKREGFVGREWLFKEASDWMALDESRSMLIVGDPGFGKSAIVAEMVKRRIEMGVIGWFCCRWDYPDQLTPRTFVEAIAASLAENLPGYAAMLTTSELQTLLEKAQSGTQIGPRTLFEQLVLGPLGRLPDQPLTSRLIVIDALDESLCIPQGIVDLLSDTLHQWPRWLRIIATSRAYPDILQSLHGMEAVILRADGIQNKADLAAYIASNLQVSSDGNKNLADDIRYSYVVEAAQGNFLIAKVLIGEIQAGHLSLEALHHTRSITGNSHLPPGLQVFYDRSFSRLFSHESNFKEASIVLSLALAALEPLDLAILRAASGLDNAKLGFILKKIAIFLPLRPDKRFAFFHKSVHDWLNADTVDDQYGNPLAKRFAIDIQVGRKLLAEWAHREFQVNHVNAPRYALRHLIGHLAEIGDLKKLHTHLFDFNWLSTKLHQLGMQSVLEDFERLPFALSEERPVKLLRRTLQMVSHILARSPEQLAPQLLGRVPKESGPELTSLCQGARRWHGYVCLLPLRAYMLPPGALLRVFEGHENWVSCVAFSRDGTYIVSGSKDMTLRLWNANTGESTGKPLTGHLGKVTSAAFSPDGTHIVSGSDDGTLRLWNAHTGTPVWNTSSRRAIGSLFGLSEVTSVAFSPDGNRIVSGSNHGEVQVWDTLSGQPTTSPMKGNRSRVMNVAFSADGTTVISVGHDLTLRQWNAHNGELIYSSLERNIGWECSVAFSKDGTRIVSGSTNNTLRLWDPNCHEPSSALMVGHKNWVTSVAFNSDATRIVSGSDDKTLRLWNAVTGEPIGMPLAGHTGWITSVTFSHDSTRIVSGGRDNTLRLWDAHAREPISSPLPAHTGWVHSVDCSHDGTRIVSGGRDNMLRLWDAHTGESSGIPLAGHRSVVRCVAFNPNGTCIVSGSDDSALRLWDPISGEAIGEPLTGHIAAVSCVAFNPDGTCIVSGSRDNTLRLWDFNTGRSIGLPLIGHMSCVNSVAFSPDGSYIISGSDDKTLRLWNARTGQPIGTSWVGHMGWVTTVAFSPDGTRIASGGHDNTLRLWDKKSGEQISSILAGHTGTVTGVAFSPDGTQIISSSHDNTLRLWDVKHGTSVTKLDLDAGILSVAWRSNVVVTGNASGMVNIFHVITSPALKA